MASRLHESDARSHCPARNRRRWCWRPLGSLLAGRRRQLSRARIGQFLERSWILLTFCLKLTATFIRARDQQATATKTSVRAGNYVSMYIELWMLRLLHTLPD